MSKKKKNNEFFTKKVLAEINAISENEESSELIQTNSSLKRIEELELKNKELQQNEQQKINELKEKLEELTVNNEELKKRNMALEKESKKYEASFTEGSLDINKLKNELREAQDQLAKTKNEFELNLQEQAEDKEKQLAFIEDLQEQLEKLTEDYTNAKVEVANLRDEKAALVEQNKVTIDEVTLEHKNKLEKLKEKCAELEKENNEYLSDVYDSGNRISNSEISHEMDKLVDDLKEKNQKLEEENKCLQKEVGEVLIVANRQASKQIAEAEEKAKQIINSTELELESFSNRAKMIALEVDNSKIRMAEKIDDLQSEIRRLIDKRIDQKTDEAIQLKEHKTGATI